MHDIREWAIVDPSGRRAIETEKWLALKKGIDGYRRSETLPKYESEELMEEWEDLQNQAYQIMEELTLWDSENSCPDWDRITKFYMNFS